jgi:ketosteroid isomerase-like protein
MSREDVENLRQGFEEYARGDVDAVLSRLDPNVDWRPAIAPSSAWRRSVVGMR